MTKWQVEMNDASFIDVDIFPEGDEADAMNIAEDIRSESGDPEWAVGAQRVEEPEWA